MGQPEEIPYQEKRGKLLSVGFFKKIQHQQEFLEGKSSDLPRQPVVFIYQNLSVEKLQSTTINIEIRDSKQIFKNGFNKQIYLENYSAENPLAFYEIDHTDMDNQLDLEKDALYFEGSIFYYQMNIYDELEIIDKTGK